MTQCLISQAVVSSQVAVKRSVKIPLNVVAGLNRIWLPGMVTRDGYPGWLPGMATRVNYPGWLPGLITRDGYPGWLSCMVSRHARITLPDVTGPVVTVISL